MPAPSRVTVPAGSHNRKYGEPFEGRTRAQTGDGLRQLAVSVETVANLDGLKDGDREAWLRRASELRAEADVVEKRNGNCADVFLRF